MNKKAGRPPKPEGQARNEVITVRLLKTEKSAILRAVKQAGGSQAKWLRGRLLNGLDI
jgi:hypothetical protein